MSRRNDRERETSEPGDVGRVEEIIGEVPPPAAPPEVTTPASVGSPLTVSPGAGAHLYRIRRIPGQRVMTGVPVRTAPRTTVWAPAKHEDVFEVDRLTAIAAVETGAFAVTEDSPAKLKERR